MTITEQRQKRFSSPAYMEIKQYVLYRAGTKKPKSPEELIDSKICYGS